MIGRIKGRLIEKQPPMLLVDVNGVGYEINAPMSTIYQLPELENEVVLHTQLIVREDAQLLYGFYSKQERQLFRALIRVNGVGPKMALAILSGMSANEFIRCVHDGDTTSLIRLPGVGKKTAERLLVEMRDRLKDFDGEAQASTDRVRVESRSAGGHSSVTIEAESALVALGYKPAEASRAIAKLDVAGLSSEEVIRQALKNMVNK